MVKVVHLLLTTPAPLAVGAECAGSVLLDFINNVNVPGKFKSIATGQSQRRPCTIPRTCLILAGVVPEDSTLTYSTAGPSPGNGGFTDLFTATFSARKLDGESGCRGRNLNLVNILDIVPQAWCPLRSVCERQNVGNILLGVTIVFACTLSSGAVFSPLPSQYFSGPPPSDPPESLEAFLQISGSEDIRAYIDEGRY